MRYNSKQSHLLLTIDTSTNQSIILFLILKKISFRKILNALKVYISYLFSRILRTDFRWGYPISVSIEPSSFCNLQCPECPVGNGINTMKSTISAELFESIIDELSPYLLNLFLYFQGEPFLNKKLAQFAEYAARSKNIYTVISTNGHFLNEPTAISIIRSGLDKIIISLDGACSETYEKYRVGGNFELIIENILRLSELKKKLHSQTPHIELQFVVTAFNEHEIQQIKALSKKLGVDKLKLKSAQIYNFEKGSPMIPKNAKYSRYQPVGNVSFKIKSKLKNHCERLWNSAVINTKGEVLPCCFDKSAEHVVGNINKNSFSEINNSVAYRRFRQKLLNNRKSISICTNCTEGLYR